MKSFRFENEQKSAIVTAFSFEDAAKINAEHPEMNLPFIGEENGFFARKGKEAIEYTDCLVYISFYDKENSIGWAECI